MVVRALRHVGITVGDAERAIRFWRDYLGFVLFKERLGQSGYYISSLVGLPDAVVDIRVFKGPDGALIELLKYHSHPAKAASPATANEPGRPHIALTVTDLPNLYARREEFGVTFKSPPQRSPDDPVLVAYCNGPDGVIVELVQILEEG